MISDLYTIFLKHPTVSTDSRNIIPNCIFFALKGANFNGNKYASDALQKGAAYAVIDEEEFHISDKTILVKDVLKALQQLANHHRKQLNIPIIGLTGSNGKTTTKELINAVLSKKFNTTATKGNLNNHIGVPLTLLSMTNKTEIGIVEMGANHHKEIDFLCSLAEPDYGYITNFGKAHLEGFGSPEGVVKAKSELYGHLNSREKMIFVNGDDEKQLAKTTSSKRFIFSSKQDSDLMITFIDANPLVRVHVKDTDIASQLIGSYNFHNISAAITIGSFFDVSLKDIKDAISSYIPSNNRSQITLKNTNKIILDAYNANPTSMKAALDNFSNLSDSHKIAFLGDMFELGKTAETEHQFISNYCTSLQIDTTYLIGENFAKTNNTSKNIKTFTSFEELKEDFPKIENTTLLIKGSRGMALERILDLL